jgi:hypothetical protein
MRTALFWVITQRVVVISNRRFGTTHRSRRMRLIDCSETSVRNYYYWLRNNLEEYSSHLLGVGSLKPRTGESV